jgi:transposase
LPLQSTRYLRPCALRPRCTCTAAASSCHHPPSGRHGSPRNHAILDRFVQPHGFRELGRGFLPFTVSVRQIRRSTSREQSELHQFLHDVDESGRSRPSARSTLANWVGGACWWLEPLQARLAAHVFGSTKLFADDTPIPVLDPGRGRTKTGRLWVYARDDRPWSGPEPPAAVYFYSPDRKAERPAAHLQDFRGVLQVDGYAGFERLTAPGDIVLAACWAHARRKFYDLHEATGSPIAAEASRRIAELYAIEGSIRGRTAKDCRHVRNTSARPLIKMMKPWLAMELDRVPLAGPLAETIRYALARWPALTRFLDDGRIELDNNPVERAIRPIALGRKNHLFAGSDGGGVRWATICSLIATAKLNNVEPFAWLRDILQRMTDGHPASRLDELLPWNWQPISVKA